jgi:hypothetical protein
MDLLHVDGAGICRDMSAGNWTVCLPDHKGIALRLWV